MVKSFRTWKDWKGLKLEKGSRLNGITLAKIHTERDKLKKHGKPSDHDFRYEWWSDAHAFYKEYLAYVEASTGFYYEIIDGDRPCHFYISFPIVAVATNTGWLESTFTNLLRAAFTESLPSTTPFTPNAGPLFWSDGSMMYVYWYDIVFESPTMCGLFVQKGLQDRLEPHGISFNLNVYPTSTDDFEKPTKIRFPFSGKRLLGTAVECSRPLFDHETNEWIRRSTITMLPGQEKEGLLKVICLCDEVDETIILLPSDHIAYLCSFSRTAGSSLDIIV